MLTIDDILLAQKRISPYLNRTPLIPSQLLQSLYQKKIWLKLETQLPTGSFKPRPAFNSILSQLELARQKGVVASSSGNFAQGVAFAARTLGVDAIIVMPEKTVPFKIERTKALGATVVLCGNRPEERMETTLRLQKETERVLLQPYDSYETVAGDATVGLEIKDQLGSECDKEMTVLVPVSGAGLVAGVAFALKSFYPNCRVVGIQSEVNGSLKKSLAAGHCVDVGAFQTIADALITSSVGEIPFKMAQQYLDDVILVKEETIRTATQFFIEQHKLVVEPGGALPLAALMANQVKTEKVICIVSGGNINLINPGGIC